MNNLISREALIEKYAKEYAKSLIMYGVDISEKYETATQISFALERAYMRGRQDELDKLKEHKEKQLLLPQWISCSERLPEDDENVLVWFEYFRYGEYNRFFQTIGISYTFNGEWSGFVNGSSGWRQLRIIAWMPLPEPYKGE